MSAQNRTVSTRQPDVPGPPGPSEKKPLFRATLLESVKGLGTVNIDYNYIIINNRNVKGPKMFSVNLMAILFFHLLV